MNTIKLTAVAVFSIFTLITFTSCTTSVEPVDSDLLGNIVNPTSIVGAYTMTAFNTGIPTDLNNNGTASINQMSETTCFNDNIMIINANNTFNVTQNGLDINTTATTSTMECNSDPLLSGTWALNGTILTLTYDDAGTPVVETFLVASNTLTYSVPLGEIVGTTSTNEPVFLTSSINIVYTR
ncbi:Lipocalin-like domain containing protein [Flavobacteriaceae bacterium]